MNRGLYAGRFRIFHKGYMEVVKHILDQGHSGLVIAIGAAQQSHCLDNPFSGEEREEMVARALREEGLNEQVDIVQIDETSATYENWARFVEGLCPPFHLVYSHNELARSLFRRLGYQTSLVPQFSKSEYSFDMLLRKIVNCEPWHNLLPAGVLRIMERYELVQRIEELYSKRQT